MLTVAVAALWYQTPDKERGDPIKKHHTADADEGLTKQFRSLRQVLIRTDRFDETVEDSLERVETFVDAANAVSRTEKVALADKLGQLEVQYSQLEPSQQITERELARFRNEISKRVADADEKRQSERLVAIEKAIAPERQEAKDEIRSLTMEVKDWEDKIAYAKQQSAEMGVKVMRMTKKAYRERRFQRDMREIKSLLSPFVSDGHLQLKGSTHLWEGWRKSAFEGPISYSALEGLGALNETTDGLNILYQFGGAKHRGAAHDRPLGSFPRYSPSDFTKRETLIKIKRAQQLLRDHGRALVESGMLSP